MTSAPIDSQPQPPRAARAAIALAAVAAVAAVGLLATRELAEDGASGVQTVALATTRFDLCQAVDDGYLSGHLYGALDRAIEWRGTDMTCEGGTRPNGNGFRVVFAAPIGDEHPRLVFVIGISGSVGDLIGAERVANITLIEESSGRFFSSGGQERCWTTVQSVDREGERVRIGGEIYCQGSLPSLSDGSSITLRDFRYSGRLVLDDS